MFAYANQCHQSRNSAARLMILKARRHQQCTRLLQQLHWLPISQRSIFFFFNLLACVHAAISNHWFCSTLISLNQHRLTVHSTPSSSALQQTRSCIYTPTLQTAKLTTLALLPTYFGPPHVWNTLGQDVINPVVAH